MARSLRFGGKPCRYRACLRDHQKSKWYLRERGSGDGWYWILAFGSVAYFIICWLLTLLAVGAVTGLIKPN